MHDVDLAGAIAILRGLEMPESQKYKPVLNRPILELGESETQLIH